MKVKEILTVEFVSSVGIVRCAVSDPGQRIVTVNGQRPAVVHSLKYVKS